MELSSGFPKSRAGSTLNKFCRRNTMFEDCNKLNRKRFRWRKWDLTGQHKRMARFSLMINILLCFGTVKVSAESHSLTFDISENLPESTQVGTVINGESFYIVRQTVGVDDAFDLGLVQESGVIETKVSLNRENIAQYNMTLYHAASEDTYKVTVDVLDVNDNSPTFAQENITLEVSELSAVGSEFNLGSAQDDDAPPLSVQGYRLAKPSDYFSVNTTQLQDGTTRFAELVVLQKLDRETTPYHIVVVEAFDGGIPSPRTGRITVNVSVSDSNDNPPSFTQPTYDANISESATVGSDVITVEATDSDEGVNGDVTYNIDREKSDPDEFFRINPQSGTIYVNKKLDSESATEHRLTVLAKDGGVQPQIGSTVVIVRVKDVNDNHPRINVIFLGSDEGKVSEGAEIGDYIARISVSDPDVGDVEKFTVTMVGGDGRFGLKTENGVVYLVRVEELLNREDRSSYDIVLNATDFGSPPKSATASFTIEVSDINDNPPRFNQDTYEAEVDEKSFPGTFVIHLSATDMDLGINKEFEYSLLPSAQSDWFHLNPETALITTATYLDHETNPEPLLTVVATDFGTPRMSSSATVIVKVGNANDSAPRFEASSYRETIPEDTDVEDCFLQVKAIDPDFPSTPNQIIYSFAEDSEKPEDISLDPSDGQLCVAKELDRERKASYNIRIKATDKSGQRAYARVLILLSDVNEHRPRFHPVAYVANVAAATAAAGDPVTRVSATDADDSSRDGSGYGIVTYEILNGNERKLFAFNNKTGEISVAKPLVAFGDTVVSLRIRATDGGGTSTEKDAAVVISIINDTAESIGGPVFSEKEYSFAVEEDALSGKVVGTVSASATDGGEIVYFLRNDPPASEWFAVDSETGDITVASSLDREIFSVVTLQIIASAGSPPVYGFASVAIALGDVNDHAPVFNLRPLEPRKVPSGAMDFVTVPYSLPRSAVVYTLKAADADKGQNAVIQFSLTNDAGYFSVDPNSGKITLKKPLPQKNGNYSVLVRATDGGATPKATSGTIVVRALKPDGRCPSFNSADYSVSLAEDTNAAQSFKTISASSTSAVTYRLAPNADSYKFGVYPDGSLYLTSKLDRELVDSYQIQLVAEGVAASLEFSTPCVAMTTVNVTVTDVNDNMPFFDPDTTRFTIAENLPAGSVVGTVSASDGDIGTNAELRYSLATESTVFKIDSESGIVTTTRPLDRESTSAYAILVQTRDAGDTPLMSQASVRVSVADVNDNAPRFLYDNSPVLATVEEKQIKGTFVALLQAVDNDSGERGKVSYSISSGPGHFFQINVTTGRVSTKTSLDAGSTHSLVIRAEDHGDPVQSSTISLQVKVISAVDNPAKFKEDSYVFPTGVTTEPGAVLGRFENRVASNRVSRAVESSLRSTVVLTNFYISEGNENDDFTVNRETGELFASRKLSFETKPQYSLTITAENVDDPSEIHTFRAQINVQDANDFAPVFSAASYHIAVRENVPVNTKIWKFSATDKDIGANGEIEYSILSQMTSSGLPASVRSPFGINPATGQLYNRVEIDREREPEYMLVIKATDGSSTDPRWTTVSALVTVQDMNDNRPRLVSQDSIHVLEDEPVGFPVINLLAEDDDLGENQHVTYSVNGQWSSAGHETNVFQLNPSTGLITLVRKLNYEAASTYYVNVSATDSAALDPLTAHQLLVINVVDVNDETPRFDQDTYFANVEENEEAGALVVRVTATDGDSGVNGDVTYEIFDKNDAFKINRKSGVVVTTRLLDREAKDSYAVIVYAHDGAFPSLYTWCVVEISISDANDNSPRFATGPNPRLASSGEPVLASIEVPEYEPASSLVYTVLATDLDSGENGRMTYAIAAGNRDDSFTVNSTTGEIRTKGRLDRERTASYRLEVVVADSGVEPRSSKAVLEIVVIDWNDNDPVFNKASYHGHVAEGLASGQFVLAVHADDADVGLNAKVTYSIDPGTSEFGEALSTQPEGLFSVHPETGVVTTTDALDREKKKSHQFVVQAIDSAAYGPRKTSVTVTVDVLDINDNYPVFTETLIVKSVNQNIAVGSDIATASAQDKDDGDNGTVFYRITGGTTEPYGTTGVGKFQVDSRGRITTTEPLDGAYTYNLNVTASDNGNPPNTAEAVVVVNVESSEPRNFVRIQFQKPKYEVDLREKSEKNARVTKVQADLYEDGVSLADADRTVSIIYHFASGNEEGAFAIGNDGVITVKDPSQLDFETLAKIRLIVSAVSDSSSGGGPMYAYSTVLIGLIDENDNAPRFAQDLYKTKIWEEQDEGTYMMQVTARDADSAQNAEVRYYIDSGNKDESFHIDEVTGIVTTAVRLDRETFAEYKLTVYAYDLGTPRLSGTCTVKVTVVDMNDNTPTLNVPASGSLSVSESVDVGAFIARVTANDRDEGITEFLFSGDGDNQNDYFTIGRQDGTIHLAKPLDYEEMHQAKVVVRATDGQNGVEEEIVLNIEDSNDNAPVFELQSYQATLDELSPVNTPVTSVHANDADSGQNANVTYSLIDIVPKRPIFYVNAISGVIFTNVSEAYNPQSSIYNLIVMAEDHGETALNCTIPVRIEIQDINNHAPMFNSDAYKASISEAAERGTHVVNMTATDADFSNKNKHIYYEITSGNGDGAFKIDTYAGVDGENAVGEISVAAGLDREEAPTYTLTVTAYDQGVPQKSRQAVVTVTVDDVNDNQPIFNQSSYSASVAENVKKEPVVKVFASDADSSSSLMFKITAGNDDSAFEIGECEQASEGCALISAKNLDYEKRSAYNLTVQVWDGRETATSKSSIVPVKIKILDVNEHAPYFSTLLSIKKVSESVHANETVFYLPGEDKDGGEFGELYYTILNGVSTGSACLPADEMFFVVQKTGEVKSKFRFDYEKCRKYQFRVRVENAAGRSGRLARSQPSVSHPVEIDVTSVDEFPPVFADGSDRPIKMTVPYSAPAGHVVGKVNATDSDTGPDGKITYRLDEDPVFVINSSSGVITLSKRLESDNNRVLTVTAISGKRTASTLVSIEIEGAPAIALEAQILAIVFGVIAGIAVVIVLILCVKHRKNKKAGRPANDLSTSRDATPIEFHEPHLPHSQKNGVLVAAPRFANGKANSKKIPSSNQFGSGDTRLDNGLAHFPVHGTNGHIPVMVNGARLASSKSNSKTKVSVTSNGHATKLAGRDSISSGRGSDPDNKLDVDMEVDMINSSSDATNSRGYVVPKPKIRRKLSGQGRHKKHVPDSGIQKDIDVCSDISDGPNNIKSPSVESIHVFGDEGAGEEPLSIQDIEEDLEKEIQNGLKESKILSGILKASHAEEPHHSKPEHTTYYKSPLGTESNKSNKSSIQSKRGGGSVGADSAYSRRGRLSNWAPEFQPLADVFSEIARLKDRENAVRTGNRNNFVMKDLSNPPYSESSDPPPLITSVAEQRNDLVVPVPLGFNQTRAPARRNPANGLVGLYPPYNTQYARGGHNNLPTSSYYHSGLHSNAALRPNVTGPVKPQVAFNMPLTNMSRGASSINSSQQGLSVSSLPRTPISHESSFTSPAMSPNLTPSLSPLATRSPSVSTVGESVNQTGYDSDERGTRLPLSKSDPNLASYSTDFPNDGTERMVHV